MHCLQEVNFNSGYSREDILSLSMSHKKNSLAKNHLENRQIFNSNQKSDNDNSVTFEVLEVNLNESESTFQRTGKKPNIEDLGSFIEQVDQSPIVQRNSHL